VPPGFTVTTDVCTYYYGNKNISESIESGAGSTKWKNSPVKKFVDVKSLLVSVRSGARRSMPGMMELY
jgi:pyruvate,orthophosphate dikinase